VGAEPLIQASLLGEAIDGGPALVFVADEHMRYVAVNQFAADVLGYTRSELLALRVSDVAAYADASDEYGEVVLHGARRGKSTLTRKDGTTVTFRYVATETRVAGMPLYVSVGFLA